MKDMKELQKMSDAELATFIAEKRAEIQKHRFGMGGRDVKAARTAKTEVARALTIVNTRVNEANA